jgi:hypothetical protein
MKKIKGGKREGAGRPKTGRKTKVVSFSVPTEFEKEIDRLVRGKLSELSKVKLDIAEIGVSIVHTSTEGEVKRIDPLSEEGIIIQQMAAYEEELKTLPDVGLGKKRKIFVEGKIRELKKQLK